MTALTVSVPFQGLVPFAAARRAGLGDPHLSLAPSGPNPNGLGRSIRHAPTPTSPFPARELYVKAHTTAKAPSTTAP